MHLTFRRLVKCKVQKKGGIILESTLNLAVRFLGILSITLVVGFIVCFLAVVGYNSYIKYKDKHKEIEVHTKNSNLQK